MKTIPTYIRGNFMHSQFPSTPSITRLAAAAAFLLLLTAGQLPAQGEWTRIQTPATENLLSIDFPTAMIGYACGDGGTLVKTTDGGLTWTEQNSGIAGSIWTIRFSSATNGMA